MSSNIFDKFRKLASRNKTTKAIKRDKHQKIISWMTDAQIGSNESDSFDSTATHWQPPFELDGYGKRDSIIVHSELPAYSSSSENLQVSHDVRPNTPLIKTMSPSSQAHRRVSVSSLVPVERRSSFVSPLTPFEGVSPLPSVEPSPAHFEDAAELDVTAHSMLLESSADGMQSRRDTITEARVSAPVARKPLKNSKARFKSTLLPMSTPSSNSSTNSPSTAIIVMGPTGAGKTRFIESAKGVDITDEYLPESVAAEIVYHEVSLGDRRGYLIDSFGLDDTCQSEPQTFKNIAAWISTQSIQHTFSVSVIYMHRITDNDDEGSTLRNLTMLKKTLGVKTFRNLLLVTSMWDRLQSLPAGEKCERNLMDQSWADLLQAGARVHRFQGDRQSALNILKGLSSEALVTLKIPREVVYEDLSTRPDKSFERPLIRSKTTPEVGIRVQTHQLNEYNQDQHHTVMHRRESFHGSLGHKNSMLKSYWTTSNRSPVQPATPPASPHQRDPHMYEPFEWDFEFRLVRLHAGFGESPIEISLAMVDITNAPDFVALSHVVGKGSPETPINFRRERWLSQIYVSENLKDALQHLRLHDTDLLIWVDVISINQDDLEERARQVRMMSQIFRAALGVCIWLGSAGEGGDEAMDFIDSILDFALLEDLVKDRRTQHKWLYLAKLMSRPWFRRRWVVQELMFAQEATVHCGDRVVDWSDFCDAAILFRTKWTDIQRYMGDAELAELGDAHFLGPIALIEIADCVFRRDADGNIVEKLLSTERLLSLLPMFEVSDLLDSVYAILDMANDLDGPNSVVVNYEQEPAELYRDTVKLIMRSSGSLDIICRPWAPKSGLPSWITTVAKHPYKRRMDRQQYDRQNGVSLVGMPGSACYHACGTAKATGENTSFRIDGRQQVLVVTGQRIGRVEELGDRCMNGNIPQEWMELAGWQSVNDPCPPEFWRSLVANRSHTGSVAPAWYGRACEFAFRKSTTDDINMTALARSIQSSHVQEFLRRVLDVTWRRTLAQVKDGSTNLCALCPPETMVYDIVCVVYGCSVPVVLRPSGKYYQLVGECYAYGIMDGEALAADSRSISTFDII